MWADIGGFFHDWSWSWSCPVSMDGFPLGFQAVSVADGMSSTYACCRRPKIDPLVERAHRLFTNVRWNGDDVKTGTDINRSRFRIDDRQAGQFSLSADHVLPRVSTPDGDSDQITFLNGVTQGATTVGSAASPGPGFLTGTDASKIIAASVRRRFSIGTAGFYPWGRGQAAKAVF